MRLPEDNLRDTRSLEEIVNGSRGSDIGEDADYSTIPDPDYSSVDGQLFDLIYDL